MWNLKRVRLLASVITFAGIAAMPSQASATAPIECNEDAIACFSYNHVYGECQSFYAPSGYEWCPFGQWFINYDPETCEWWDGGWDCELVLEDGCGPQYCG